jgi:hypothetical protein
VVEAIVVPPKFLITIAAFFMGLAPVLAYFTVPLIVVVAVLIGGNCAKLVK